MNESNGILQAISLLKEWGYDDAADELAQFLDDMEYGEDAAEADEYDVAESLGELDEEEFEDDLEVGGIEGETSD